MVELEVGFLMESQSTCHRRQGGGVLLGANIVSSKLLGPFKIDGGIKKNAKNDSKSLNNVL